MLSARDRLGCEDCNATLFLALVIIRDVSRIVADPITNKGIIGHPVLFPSVNRTRNEDKRDYVLRNARG